MPSFLNVAEKAEPKGVAVYSGVDLTQQRLDRLRRAADDALIRCIEIRQPETVPRYSGVLTALLTEISPLADGKLWNRWAKLVTEAPDLARRGGRYFSIAVNALWNVHRGIITLLQHYEFLYKIRRPLIITEAALEAWVIDGIREAEAKMREAKKQVNKK